MEQKSGLLMKIGTGVVLFLAIGFIAVVVIVLFRQNQNAQELTTLPLSIQEEEDIPDENAIAESDPATEDYEIYVVQRGATLSVIAKAYSAAFGRTITVQEIKDANDMKNDALTPGQELKIPKR
jgi:LysM repeat protein